MTCLAPSFLYPRVVKITRLETTSAVGALPYQGTTQAAETLLISGLPATITTTSGAGRGIGISLPDDSAGPIKWQIVLPAEVMATLPLIMERDFVYDDLGRRFQVAAFQPSALGAKIDAVRMTA